MPNASNGDNQVKRLRSLGVTKWRIAKELRVSWQTVHCWERGLFQPNATHQRELTELIEQWKRG